MGGTLVQDEEAIKRIEELIVSDRASTMLVCIQGTREGEPCGEIYNCYLREPVLFNGAGDMVLKLDEMCNWGGGSSVHYRLQVPEQRDGKAVPGGQCPSSPGQQG